MNKQKDNRPWIDKNFTKVIVVLITILMITVGLYVMVDSPKQSVDIVDTINGNNWVLYTMSTCPACIEQKNELGEYSDQIVIVTCDSTQHSYDLCKSNNIQRVPTWMNIKTGEHIEGILTLEDIEVMLNV